MSSRLKESPFLRPDDEKLSEALRIVYLSTEGNKTEQQYFSFLNQYRRVLGISAAVHLIPIGRRDTRSDPRSVFALLEEKREALAVSGSLQEDRDVFGIVIDRDGKTHSKTQLQTLWHQCEGRGYLFLLSSPRFEFWLLLHLFDLREQFSACQTEDDKSGKFEDLCKKLPYSKKHEKDITKSAFQSDYLPNIGKAIERAKNFTQNELALLDEWGTNIPLLFDRLQTHLT